MRTCSIFFQNNFSSIFLFSVIFSSLLPFTPQQHPKPFTTHTKFFAFSRRFLNLSELARCFEVFFLYTAAYDENQVNYITEAHMFLFSIRILKTQICYLLLSSVLLLLPDQPPLFKGGRRKKDKEVPSFPGISQIQG